MAFTIDLTVARTRAIFGNRRQTIGKITGPTSYTALGETLTPASVSLGTIEYFSPVVLSSGTAVVLLTYNHTTGKMMAFDMAGAEIAAAVNLSTYNGRFMVEGY